MTARFGFYAPQSENSPAVSTRFSPRLLYTPTQLRPFANLRRMHHPPARRDFSNAQRSDFRRATYVLTPIRDLGAGCPTSLSWRFRELLSVDMPHQAYEIDRRALIGLLGELFSRLTRFVMCRLALHAKFIRVVRRWTRSNHIGVSSNSRILVALSATDLWLVVHSKVAIYRDGS